MNRITIIVVCIFNSLLCLAQQPINYARRYGGTDTDQSYNPNQTKSKVEQDSAYYNYYYIEDTSIKKPFIDTILTGFQQYDPARLNNVDYLHQGNPGSASHTIAYTPREISGFDMGYHCYDLYRIGAENFKFFELNRPINDLYFSPSQGQASFMVKAKFARSFSEGINLSMDYQRILQSGFYASQDVKNTSFGTGLHYTSKNRKYQLLTNLFVNNVSESYNGGIATDTLFDDPFYNILANIPINIEDASIRKGEQQLVVNQIYQLRDSSSWNIQLKHRLRYTHQDYRFSDETTDSSTDSLVYRNFLIETRGIRNAYQLKIIDNYASIALVNNKALSIETGIDYAHHLLEFDDRRETIHSSFIRAQVQTKISDTYGFSGDVNLGLLDFIGDFDLTGKIYLDIKKNKFSAGAKIYNYSPSINHQYLGINSLAIWSNNFNNSFGTSLFGELFIPKTNTTLGIKQSIENQIVHYDNMGFPQQNEGTLSTSQLSVNQKIQFWKIRYGVDLHLQVASTDLFGLPPLFSKQSLYYEDQIFNNNMRVQLGADYRYIKYNQGLRFNPINASFYPTGEAFSSYQLLDVFLNFRISSLNVFVKQENFLDLFSTNLNYLLPLHPDYHSRLRIGIRWFILD